MAREASLTRRRSRQPRPRAAVLWGLGAFLALQLGLAVTVEYVLPRLRDPGYGYKAARLRQRFAALPAANRPPVVVVLGSSRTAHGLDAAHLEEQLRQTLNPSAVAFNFGVPGAGPVEEVLYLKRLLAEGLRPDFLVIEVLAPLLGDDHPWDNGLLAAERLALDELPPLRRYGFPVGGFRRAWCEARAVPWYTHRFTILNGWLPTWLPPSVRNDWYFRMGASGDLPVWKGKQTPEQHRRALDRARLEYEDRLHRLRLDTPTGQALRDLVALCRREAVPAALVLMPEGPVFRGWYPPGLEETLESHVAGLCREHGLPFINAHRWLPEDCFADSHHLLPDGARAFTERLGREVLQVWPKSSGQGPVASGQ